MYLSLFLSFLKIGFISFGGGYAMIPVIEYEVKSHRWLTTQEFTDAVAIAGMSPGPIATNSAVFVGYKIGGVFGAFISAFAVTLPSLLIVLLLSIFMYKAMEVKVVSHAFHGLRPVITGLITYAAFNFAIQNDIIGSHHWWKIDVIGIIIVAGAFILLYYVRMKPVTVILVSGLLGVLIYM